jgi:nitrogen fixation NifU-like protein
MTTQKAKGKSIKEAKELTRTEVAEALDGRPPQKMHCSNLAADALYKAIEDYESKQKAE